MISETKVGLFKILFLLVIVVGFVWLIVKIKNRPVSVTLPTKNLPVERLPVEPIQYQEYNDSGGKG
jgi:hypothetical protein